MKKLSILIIIAVILAVAMGAASAGPNGKLKVSGSTTVLPIAQLWAEEFMAKNPGALITVSGGGSGAGISQLLNGTCDIANASRGATQSEYAAARTRNSKMIETRIARDGMAIIVNPANNVKNLIIPQLTAIYSGKVSSWNQVGGKSNDQIVVVGRDTASGTYGFFQEVVLGGGAYRKDMLSMPSNAAVAAAVAQSKDAIGYVGMGYAEKFAAQGKVHILSISRHTGEPGQKPTTQTVKSGTYPLFRFLYVYTLGRPRGLASDFLKFGLSPEGQELVKKAEYVAL